MLFFVVNQQSISVPNQEIKLQISKVASSQEVNSALLSLELQLHNLGATNISVYKDENGNFKLNYFSNQAVFKVESIVRNLSDISHNSNVKLDVYEIKKSTFPTSGIDYKTFIEHKSEYDRYLNSNVYAAIQTIKYKDLAVAIQYKISLKQNIVLCLSNTLHNIPEVRAGPIV